MNSKILKINKKLSKLASILPNISFLDSNNDSKLFTRHGLHRNKLGKKLIIAQIANHIFSIFKRKTLTSLPLAWYKPIEVLPDENQTKNLTRNSSRLRKIPVTRTDDFFMVNSKTSHTGNELILQSNPTSSSNFNFNFKSYFKASYQNSEDKTYKCATKQIKQHLRPHICSPSNFKVLHQNVRGITHKTEELLISLFQIDPQVLCLTEHHLRPEEISIICCIWPCPGRERIINVVPRDGRGSNLS
jgi:hypothetical protein